MSNPSQNPLDSGLSNRMPRAPTTGARPGQQSPGAPSHTPGSPQLLSHTYKGNAGSQEKDPYQEVFKLFNHQLPQGLPWGKRQGEDPGVKLQWMNSWDSRCKLWSRD